MKSCMKYMAVLVLVVFLATCASDSLPKDPPSWINQETTESGDYILFTASGQGITENDALDDMAINMTENILDYMGFSPSDFDDFPQEKEYIISYIKHLLENRDAWPKGISVNLSWFQEGDLISCASQLKYKKNLFDHDKEALRASLIGDNPTEKDLERARELGDEGYFYSAFLFDMKGAQQAIDEGGLMAGFYWPGAIDQGLAHLNMVDSPEVYGPDQVNLGSRRAWTYSVDLPLSPQENDKILWRVDFSFPKKEGTGENLEVSLSSDSQGRASFSYPFPEIEGSGSVEFTLETEHFDPILSASFPMSEGKGDHVKAELDRIGGEKIFPIVKDKSVLNTAIVVEDRDVVGKLLSSRTTENSLISALSKESYQLEVIPFELERVRNMSELEIIREFNSLYDNKYDIILFSEAGIQDFIQVGDLYQVTAGASFYEVDLFERKVLLLDTISSSVTGEDPAKLVDSAFFQLGQDLAKICLQRNEP